MKKAVNIVCNLIAGPAMIWLVVRQIMLHGHTWEFGSLGMPEPLIGEGFRYKNGDIVDPVTFSMHQQGITQFVWWGTLIFIIVMLRHAYKMHQHNALIRAENARLRKECEAMRARWER